MAMLDKAIATNNVPFHLFAVVTNIDINLWTHSNKRGSIRQMGLLMLGLYSMVCFAAIDKITMYANAHRNSAFLVASLTVWIYGS